MKENLWDQGRFRLGLGLGLVLILGIGLGLVFFIHLGLGLVFFIHLGLGLGFGSGPVPDLILVFIIQLSHYKLSDYRFLDKLV